MPVVDVINLDGDTVGQVELSDEVFAAKVNVHLLHETARHYLNARRAGTHKTKPKGEVSGAGRKLWRQKGTGRARIGSIRSPLWRKGGTVHGPVPRSYDYVVPRQMHAGASAFGAFGKTRRPEAHDRRRLGARFAPDQSFFAQTADEAG